MYLSHAHAIKQIRIDTDYLNRFLQTGVVVLLLLILLYAVERNSALSIDREIKQKQARMTSAEENLSRLEIKAAQLESSQSIQSAALSVNMVPSNKISFVSVDEVSVSMK